ncbi:MAG: hypothetical protein KQI35_02965 [Bacteroidetes bacterium]|nr:hypothetical protein [Bacteroidota bacterium]
MDWIRKFHVVLLVVIVGMMITSCDKFEGDQTIPSYIKVDTIYLANNPEFEEGALTHNFTDVWVYLNDNLLGAYELPAVIPVLASGENKLTLYPGIKLNGMSGTRSPYIFIEPRVYENFNFVVDSVMLRNPTVMYNDNMKFEWMENFEDASLGLKPTSNSDTTMNRILYGSAKPPLGFASGAGYMDAEHLVFEVTTFSEESGGLDLPQFGEPVLMEMEYNTNVKMLVGLFVHDISIGIQQHSIIILNPTNNQWKKIYVNFTATIDAYSGADYFNVFFRSEKQSSEEVDYLYLDNLKVLYRDKNKK